MSLAPLDRKQQEQIIENRVGHQALKDIGPYLDTMKDGEDNSICSNPLMLSMIISLYKSGSGSLPSSRFELYEKSVDTMIRRFDVKRLYDARTQAIDLRAIECLLTRLALHRHEEHDKDISSKIIENVVRDDAALHLAWQHVEAQVMDGRFPILSCLEASPLKLRFAHLSFQEFLVAKQWVRYHEGDLLGVGDPKLLCGHTFVVHGLGNRKCTVVDFNKIINPFKHSTHTVRLLDGTTRDVVLRRKKAEIEIGVPFCTLNACSTKMSAPTDAAGVRSRNEWSSLPLNDMLNDGWWHNTIRMACHQSKLVIDAMMRSHRPTSSKINLRNSGLKGAAIIPLMLDCGLVTTSTCILQLDLSKNELEGGTVCVRCESPRF